MRRALLVAVALVASATFAEEPVKDRFTVETKDNKAFVVVDSRSGETVSGRYADAKEANVDAANRNKSEKKGGLKLNDTKK